MSKLRFGIMCDNRRFPAWAAECVRHLLASAHAEPVVLITRVSEPKARAWSSNEVLYRLYAEQWLSRRSRALRTVQLPDELERIDQMQWVEPASAQSFSPAELERIRGYRLDFLLCVGARQIAGDVLKLPRFGVWSYRHDGVEAPCFWEILAGEPKTRTALDRLGPAGVPEVNLQHGVFGTCRASWVNNIDRAFLGSADWCARACAEISAGVTREPRREPASNTPALARRLPSNAELLGFLLRSGSHMFAKLWELLFHVEVWNVGFSPKSVEQILHDASVDAETVTWCKPHKPGHFIADPFAYVDQGEEHVLVEDYDGLKGKISRLAKPDAAEQVALTLDFEHPYHMSYPGIFCEDGAIYCVPETYQWGRAGLYKRVNDDWALVRTLLEGHPVVDPTLFKHAGSYWLLFTRQDDGAWGNLKLYAYHAESLTGEWKPHLLNPVKCDIGASRPAGSVMCIDGVLYRPSQDCSETYGGAVVINRILKLSATEFEEVEAARIEPMRNGPYPAGLHTINPMGLKSVFDSKKFSFDPFAWQKNWGRLHEVFR